MGKIIKYEISDEDVEKLKKVYEVSKNKLPGSISDFDEFLVWSVNVAIKTHVQLASINEKMMDFLNFPNADFNDLEFGDISQFVNNIFDKETNSAKDKKPTVNPKDISKKN